MEKKLIFGLTIIIGIIIFVISLGVSVDQGWVTLSQFYGILVIGLIIIILLTIAYTLKYFKFSFTGGRAIVNPVRAGQIIKYSMLHYFGYPDVTIEPMKPIEPQMKAGRDPVWWVYLSHPPDYKKKAVKIPLGRGEEAIKEVLWSIYPQYRLKFDRREDKLFSPDVSIPFIESLEDMPEDLRRDLFSSKERKPETRKIIEKIKEIPKEEEEE